MKDSDSFSKRNSLFLVAIFFLWTNVVIDPVEIEIYGTLALTAVLVTLVFYRKSSNKPT